MTILVLLITLLVPAQPVTWHPSRPVFNPQPIHQPGGPYQPEVR
jgi:hypothetical protein